MKIVFSRKGFDSSAGGCPSPIVGHRPMSLPIPTTMPSLTRYRDLPKPIPDLVTDLTRGKIGIGSPCHLDPDLDATSYKRSHGWRGALGQVAAAQGHLRNQGISPGDLFMFWGLFRQAVKQDRWRFVGMPEHRIFGWLQVGEILEIGSNPAAAIASHRWLSMHPHLQPGWPVDNVVYVASDRLLIEGEDIGLKGWGLFEKGFRLTMRDGTRPTLWQVPDWLNPANGGVGMTYNPETRWSQDGTVKIAARGQEFVADIGNRDDAPKWLKHLFEMVE